jgi:hypothetical protein
MPCRSSIAGFFAAESSAVLLRYAHFSPAASTVSLHESCKLARVIIVGGVPMGRRAAYAVKVSTLLLGRCMDIQVKCASPTTVLRALS